MRQGLGDGLRHVESVGAGLLIHRDQRGGTALVGTAQRVVFLPQFCASDILETHNGGAVVAGAQDDVFELGRLGQAPLGGHRKGLLHGFARRGLADTAHGKLLVLVGHRFLHIGGGDPQLCHAVRLEPDPHCIVRRAEDGGLVGPGDALDRIEQVQVGVVGDVRAVVAVTLGIHRQDHHERR
ncbi:hypothetical protein D3C80_1460160 [compost metagenome]